MTTKKTAEKQQTTPVIQNLSIPQPGEPKAPGVTTYPDGTVRTDN